MKVPDGFEYKLDEKDLRIGPLRDLAIKHQLSQEQVNQIVALEAQMQIAAHRAEEAAIATELAKLGDNGRARVEALEGNLARMCSTADEYEAIRAHINTAAAFSGLEKLLAKGWHSIDASQRPRAAH